MASAAEQLAANLNFGALAKSEDLKSRIWFTLGALIVYRLGTYIPIPGIDTIELAKFAAQNTSGILGWVNGLAGGALGRMAIFELLVINDEIRKILLQKPTAESVLQVARKQGFLTIQEEGVLAVATGATSLQELQRVLTPPKT